MFLFTFSNIKNEKKRRERRKKKMPGNGNVGNGNSPGSIANGVTNIRDLEPGMNKLSLEFIVVSKIPLVKTDKGIPIHGFEVADNTGSIMLNIWGEDGKDISPSEIFRLRGGYVGLYKGEPVLYIAKDAVLERLGNFTRTFSLAVRKTDILKCYPQLAHLKQVKN